MATFSGLSFEFTDRTVTTTVADDDIARLMYYLNCVTVGVGLDVLQDDLVRYQNYQSLSPARIALVFQTAAELSPDHFIDKLIFLDDDGKVVGKGFENKFVRISTACDIVSLQRDIFLMGKVRNASQVMFFKSTWLDVHYTQPIQRIARIILGTKHCSHCEGVEGVCTCMTCPRTDESKCMNFFDAFAAAFTGAMPSRSVSPMPKSRPVTPQPPSENALRPGEHRCNCDGCGWRLFTGIRYKCSTCHDYDLCEVCYKANKHDMGHRFHQYVSPNSSPILLAARARPVPPPPQPHLSTDNTSNHPPPPYAEIPTTTSSLSPFFYDTMSASELKNFLKNHGVAFDDILDKETLCRRAWDAHCDSIGMVELNRFLLESSTSTTDCRDIASRRQKAKDAFRPPTRPAPPPASANTSVVRWRKDDNVVLTGLNRAEMNGKRGSVVSVDHELGKVLVRIEEMDRSFKVKFENLQIPEEDEELD